MFPPSARALLIGLQNTLTTCGVDYEQEIKGFGQVAESEKRANGYFFELRDHICGLLSSQLSNQRPWKRIAENEDQIRQIFFDYDPSALQKADPDQLETELCAIRCGNRRIRRQMQALKQNISTFQLIEKDFGSLDTFVTSHDPDLIAKQLSGPGRYKLIEVGFPLALEYLKNVGISAGKPDVHVLRILGPERLSYFDRYPTECEAYQMVARLAAESDCNATYLDNLLWLFCAQDYGSVCGDQPRCGMCALRQDCRYTASHTGSSKEHLGLRDA